MDYLGGKAPIMLDMAGTGWNLLCKFRLTMGYLGERAGWKMVTKIYLRKRELADLD